MEKKDLALVLMALGIVVALVVMSIGITSKDEGRRTMTVGGAGEIISEPDEATVYIVVNTLNDTAAQAQAENSKKSAKVLEALKQSGINAEDIETSGYYLNQKYEWTKEESKMVGYELSHSMKVKTKDTKNVGKYLDAAINAGANRIDTISFGLSKEKQVEVKKLALEKASKAAREKAEGIADSVGINLGRIVSVSESDFYYRPYVNNYYKADMAAAEGNYISPGNVETTVQVSLTYELN